MKILRFALSALMIVFGVVQYNDPDGLWWAFIYGLAAFTLLFANWWPNALQQSIGKTLLLLVLAGFAIGVWVYWPEDANFWKTEVFWETESAREGMGMMIVLFVSLFALPVAFARSKSDTGEHRAPS